MKIYSCRVEFDMKLDLNKFVKMIERKNKVV